MQKRPVHPYGLTSALDEAFQRAGAEPHAHQGAAGPEDTASFSDEEATDSHGERLLMGHELLLAVRDPIEWLLALARRLAAGDPEDVAAIDRVTAAFHNRLACGSHGVTVRDVLTAFGILIGALDPAVVLTAARKTIADGVVTILACEGAALAGELARLVDVIPGAVHRVCIPRGRRRSAARTNFSL